MSTPSAPKTPTPPPGDKSQAAYDREANAIFNRPEMQALDRKADAAAAGGQTLVTTTKYNPNSVEAQKNRRHAEMDEKDRTDGDAARKKLDSNEAAAPGFPQTSNAPEPQKSGSRLVKWVGRLTGKQKAAGGGIIGIVIALVLGVATFSPFGMLIHLKEIASDWSDKFTSSATNTRMKKLYKERYFGSDKCGSVIKIKCRLTPKIKEVELGRLRDAGLDPIVNDRGRIVSMANPASPGQRITAANFDTVIKDRKVLAAYNKATASARSVGWRGTNWLDIAINKWLINRKAPLGDAKDQKGIVKEFRTTAYSDQNAPPRYTLDSDTEQGTDPETDKKIRDSLDKIDDSIAEQAAIVQAGAIENGPPANLAVDSGISPQNAAKKVGGAAIKGPLGLLDSICQFRSLAIGAGLAIKVYQHRALIKYAALFMTMADMAKAGDASYAQMAVLGTLLVRPSVQESSKGLTASDSALVTLTTQGKIKNYATAKRFTNGNTWSRMLENLAGTGGPGLASICRKVQAWYGQFTIVVSGIAACILTAGASCVAGAAKGAVVAVAFAALVGQLMPQLIHLLAGTIAPDPLTDPEGSYGAGNAAASGMGAMGLDAAGRANGLEPTTKAEFAVINAEATKTQKYLASVQEINNPGLFNPDNPNSLSRQLAMNFAPQMLALQSANTGSIISSFMSLVSSSPQQIGNSASLMFTPAYAAANQDKYRGDFCEDPQIKELDLATDAFCNVIYVADDKLLDSPEYEPEKVIDYLVAGNHISPDTGEATSDKFKEFLEVCVKGIEPMTPHEKVAQTCFEKRKEADYRFFRVYVMDTNVMTSFDQINDGKFGHGEATAAAPGGAAPGETSPEGWVWPADVPIHAGPCFGGPRGHAGMDINTTSANNPARAAHAGTVVRRGSGGAAGNYVTIQVSEKLFYSYEHLKSISVVEGATVTAGQQVGVIGLTGNLSVGANTKGHLHMVVSTRNTLGSYGNLNGLLNPMTVLPSPAPGGYKCTNS